MDAFGAADEIHVVEKPEILFARMDLNEVMKKVEELHPPVQEEVRPETSAQEEAAAEITLEKKPEVTIDDFAKLQFAIGEIVACEAVKKSKKLLCNQVKIGTEVRQILSGIKSDYSPEEMVGKKVMVITNLKPAKLAGLESQGMILCAEGPDGKLSLMTPERDVPSGSEVG